MSLGAIRPAIMRQFSRPSGPLGRLAGFIMEKRPSNRERNLRTLDLLGIEPADRVLEIGFGPGFALTRALELASSGHVLGIDHSELMRHTASRRNAAAVAAGRLELRVENAEALSLPEHSIDKAYAVNVFMFWADPVDVLRRIRSALRPGGRVAITLQPRNRNATEADARRAAERIVAALEAAGFRKARAQMLEMKPVSAACVLAETDT